MLSIRSVFPVAVAAGTMLAAGCAEKRAHAIPWAVAVQVRPLPPEPRSESGDGEQTSAPDLRVELPPPPSELVGRRFGPARPRVEASNADSGQGRVQGPVLAPQLPPQELARAKQQTNESLSIVERNLQAAKGRQLDSVRSDLVSKITGFAEEARQAANEGDWTRALNLAKKAQVLSQELAGTL